MSQRLSSVLEMEQFLEEVEGTDFTGLAKPLVKQFARVADTVKYAADNCKSKKEVLDTNVVSKECHGTKTCSLSADRLAHGKP